MASIFFKSDIELNFQLYLTSYVSFYLLCGSLIVKGIFFITYWFYYRTQYTLKFIVSGTNLSRTLTNVSKILSAINANILNINTYLIDHLRDIPIDRQTTDITHLAVVIFMTSQLKHWNHYEAQLITYDVIMKKIGKLKYVMSVVWRVKSRYIFCQNIKWNICSWLGLFRHENFLISHRCHILKTPKN